MAKKNTKERIFDVSIDLFSQYGYDGVSIRQIAKEVGIKESSIYNHYQSKESILESILSYYINEMLKEEAPVMQPNENLNMDFDHFYKEGSDRMKEQIKEYLNIKYSEKHFNAEKITYNMNAYVAAKKSWGSESINNILLKKIFTLICYNKGVIS